jgi:hypothetical protein
MRNTRGTIAGKQANRYNENPKGIAFPRLILTFLLNSKEKFWILYAKYKGHDCGETTKSVK